MRISVYFAILCGLIAGPAANTVCAAGTVASSGSSGVPWSVMISVLAAALALGSLFWSLADRRALRVSRSFYAALPGHVVVVDRAEHVLYFNGADSAEQEGRVRALRDVPGIDYEKVSPAVAEVFRNGKKQTFEYDLNGVQRVITMAWLPLHLFGGPCVVCYSFDNPELQNARKEAELFAAELKHKSHFLDLMVNSLSLHIYAKDVEQDFRYVFSNSAMNEFFLGRPDGVLGNRDSDLIDSEEAAIAELADRGAVGASNRMDCCTETLHDASGKLHFMRVIRRVFREENGRRILFGARLDITELNEARQAQVAAAEQLRMTLLSIGDGVAITDGEGRIVLMNPGAERMSGYSSSEAKGKPCPDCFHWESPSAAPDIVLPLMIALKTGKSVDAPEIVDLHGPDGTLYRVSRRAAPIRGVDGVPIGAVLVIRDETGECARRERLREAMSALELATELSRSAAFRVQFRTGRTSGSKLLADLWPMTPEGELRPLREWVAPEDCAGAEEAWNDLIDGRKKTTDFEFRGRNGNLSCYFRVRAALDESSSEPSFIGVIQDVTDLKSSTLKLRDATELWKIAIDAIPIMFFAQDVDHDFRYIFCNKAFADFVGRPISEVLGRTELELFGRARGAETVFPSTAAAANRRSGREEEETALDGNGVLHHLRTVRQTFSGADGQRLLLGASNDITELKNLIQCERINGEMLAATVGEHHFDTILDKIAAILQRRMRCSRVMLATRGENGALRLAREWRDASVKPMCELDCEAHYRVWDAHMDLLKNTDVIKISDARNSPLMEELFRNPDYDTRSLLVGKITVGGELWGALFVSFSVERRELSEIDEGVMQSCVNVIALAQTRERQALALKQADYEKQMLLNNINIPVWLHDAKGELLCANTTVANLAGVELERLTTAENRRIFCEILPKNVPRPVEEVIATGKAVSRNIRYAERTYQVCASPIFDVAGRLVYVVKSAVDVTDLNAAIVNEKVVNYCLETLLRENNMDDAIGKALQVVCNYIGASQGGIFQFERSGRSVSCFSECAAANLPLIFGGEWNDDPSSGADFETRFSTSENAFFDEVNAPENAAALGRVWMEFVMERQIKSLYLNRIMLHGEVWGYLAFSYEQTGHKLNEWERKIIPCVANLVEVMLHRKEAQKQLLESLEHAKAADKAKSFFLASVSHEIRTPLNAVIGFSELLKSGTCSREEQREYLDNIVYSGNALLQMVNDVLDLSKLEAGQMTIMPESTDFGVLAENVLRFFSGRPDAANVKMNLNLRPIPPLLLDKLRIRQILFNLVGNALKFTQKGTVAIWGEFLPTTDDAGVFSFGVKDTGIGISDCDKKKLTEPFVQLSPQGGNGAGNRGSGLGLSICRRLAGCMGGELRVESELGKGSNFGVVLPDVSIDDTLSGGKMVPAVELLPEERDFLAGLRVLIVDDVNMNLRILEALLRNLGISGIVGVESGQEALERTKKESFDVVLTDVWMPVMSGTELAYALHSQVETAALPVAALTADEGLSGEFPAAEFFAVLVKPLTLDKIRDLLTTLRNRKTGHIPLSLQ